MKTVQDIMTQEPACGTPESDLSEVAQLMVQHDCGAVPIVENYEARKLVGIITDRDITCRAVARGQEPRTTRVRECMSTDVITVRPETSLEECCTRMEAYKVRRLPVVDQDGRLCGMVAQADIAKCAPEHEAFVLLQRLSQPPGTPPRTPVMPLLETA
jgi:CBS domain-containing protein